jgi:RNA polymerase subunit RPABC4/transcription elongation factor Spt4
MTAPSGRLALLLILIFFGIFAAFVLTPLALAPLGIFAGLAHGARSIGAGSWHFHPWFPLFPIWGFSLFFFVLWIVVLVWVYKDAERRGMSGVLWALLVFFGNLLGFLIFLIVRQDHPVSRGPEARKTTPAGSAAPASPPPAGPASGPAAPAAAAAPRAQSQAQAVAPVEAAAALACPSCKKPVEKSYTYCPHCGTALQQVCKNCGKPVEAAWKACPYCGTALKSE